MVRVSVLPKGAKEKRSKRIVLAHGEQTGHAHTIEDGLDQVKMYESDGKLYLEVNGEVEVIHQEHKPITLTPGIWEVGQVNEYDYMALMARKVVD